LSNLITIPPSKFGALGDATLVSFAWEREGRDVAIQLNLASGVLFGCAFTWVDRLRIHIKQRDSGSSQPFAWEGTATQLPSGRIQVQLDFAGQGSVSLECNEIMTDGR
jgi:hypothetical protein